MQDEGLTKAAPSCSAEAKRDVQKAAAKPAAKAANTLVMIKDKLTDLCGNGLFKHDDTNTFCEINARRSHLSRHPTP